MLVCTFVCFQLPHYFVDSRSRVNKTTEYVNKTRRFYYLTCRHVRFADFFLPCLHFASGTNQIFVQSLWQILVPQDLLNSLIHSVVLIVFACCPDPVAIQSSTFYSISAPSSWWCDLKICNTATFHSKCLFPTFAGTFRS